MSLGGRRMTKNTEGGSRFRVDVVDETKPTRSYRSSLASFFSFGHAVHPEETMAKSHSDTLVSKPSERKESQMSFGNVQTMERLPNIHFYKDGGADGVRPTLSELRAADLLADEMIDEEAFELGLDDSAPKARVDSRLRRMPKPDSEQPVKFGWIQGVLVRCVLNIVGVMFYLRLSWVAGQAGLGLASAIVLLSSTVTFITALSMCAICTNGEIKGGGAYFMISRSLGAEFGGSIGVVFTLANVLGAALQTVGFSEALRDILKENNVRIVDGDVMDLRIIGWATASCLMVVIFVGVSFEAKAQLVFLVIFVISVINYWVGTVIPPSDEDRAEGLTGYSWGTLTSNFFPNFRDGETFKTIFGIYFPSATGIMAGANISGDLKDPSKAIPKGTLSAIVLTTILYLSVVWTTGSTCVRDASGSLDDLYAGNLSDCATKGNGARSCEYGLMNYYHVMELDSGYRYLITAGIFAATLSSALAALVSAPKIFQAVSRDPLYPFIHRLAKGYGKGDDPRRGYLVTLVLVIGVIALGDLNVIAPYVSNFFLASYCLVNYASFAASFSESPGFRPSFRYYNMWVSLLGAIMCVAIMFIVNWIAAFVTLAFVFALYVFVWYRKPDVNWGSSSQATVYKEALQKVQKLQTTEEHVKNYRPQILVLTGNPVARAPLVDFAANITKDVSLLVCGHVILMNPTGRVLDSVHKLSKQVAQWLKRRKVKGFYCPIASPNMLTGVQSLAQLSGLSRLKPNILFVGYKSSWTTDAAEQVVEYFRIVNCAFESHMGVGILRIPGGLDFSDPMKELQMREAIGLSLPEPFVNQTTPEFDIDDDACVDSSVYSLAVPKCNGTIRRDAAAASSRAMTADRSSIGTLNSNFLGVRYSESRPSLADIAQLSTKIKEAKSLAKLENKKRTSDNPERGSLFSLQESQILVSINRFRIHEKKAVIDVWWLFDDGGLTLFVPHLLTLPKSYLEGAKLRVFTIASRQSRIDEEQRSMINLLNKFRIDYQDVFLIPDITRKPSAETRKEFERIIEPFKARSTDDAATSDRIADSELSTMQQKTYRQLRTRELLLEHSHQANLIVMTLPVPRRGAPSPFLYMAWLEALTRGMPPMLLLRGNQQSVLTFYS